MAKEGRHQQPGLVRSSARTARRKENGVRAACEFCALIADVRTFGGGELLRLPPLIR